MSAWHYINNSRQMEKENRLDALNTSADQRLDCKFVTEEAEIEDSQCLRQRINLLQAELHSARQRQNRLRLTNTQLSTMVTASNKQASSRTQKYLGVVEQALQEKLHLAYRNTLIDQKISQLTDNRRNNSKQQHQRTSSNWSTLSSCPAQESRPTKRDIRDRLSGLKRIQKQLAQ